MHLREEAGGRWRTYWKNAIHTHTRKQMHISTHSQKLAKMHVKPPPHTHTEIHTPVLSRWMASLIMVEMKKWITGVHPLLRQLWPKTPPRSESYWSLEMNNQRGTRGEQHTEATYSSVGFVSTPAVHYNWSRNIFIKREQSVSYSALQSFFPLKCARVALLKKRTTASLTEPVLILKSNLFHWAFKKKHLFHITSQLYSQGYVLREGRPTTLPAGMLITYCILFKWHYRNNRKCTSIMTNRCCWWSLVLIA